MKKERFLLFLSIYELLQSIAHATVAGSIKNIIFVACLIIASEE